MIAATDRAARARDDAARLAPPADVLIHRNLTLPARVAAQYRGKRLDRDELEAIANLALVEAASKYDVALHAEESFARYAERCIRSAIREALCRAPVVRMGRDRERAALKGLAAGWTAAPVAVERLGIADPELPREDLARALAALPEAKRELLRLRFDEGKSLSQAAAELGITPAEARATYNRAIERLRASAIERN